MFRTRYDLFFSRIPGKPASCYNNILLNAILGYCQLNMQAFDTNIKLFTDKISRVPENYLSLWITDSGDIVNVASSGTFLIRTHQASFSYPHHIRLLAENQKSPISQKKEHLENAACSTAK